VAWLVGLLVSFLPSLLVVSLFCASSLFLVGACLLCLVGWLVGWGYGGYIKMWGGFSSFLVSVAFVKFVWL
jgi:hypothetical protein